MSALVSIIIPTYNRAHLIGDTLHSIQQQTYKNWECIVVDDGSSDTTEALLHTYIENDNRFRYYKRSEDKPKGANACRNYGFDLSNGEFINWFDSDDIMLPHKLSLQVAALQQNSEAPYCICQSLWYDKEKDISLGLRAKSITSNNRFEDYILYRIFWLTTAPLWRRDFIEQNTLTFDENLHQSQEYDFHIKALSFNVDYIAIDIPLVHLIKHKEAISSNIYDSVLKMQSNIKVKAKIVKNHLESFTPKGQLKFLEILTLLYKDLLSHKQLILATKVFPLLLKTIRQVDVSFLRKIVFCIKIGIVFLSYLVFGRGYNIVKPLT